MNAEHGTMALHYEINPKTGEIRMTGSSQNRSGGGSPNSGNNGSSDNSGFGCATLTAIVTMTVCALAGLGFFPGLLFSFLGAFAAYCFTKK